MNSNIQLCLWGAHMAGTSCHTCSSSTITHACIIISESNKPRQSLYMSLGSGSGGWFPVRWGGSTGLNTVTACVWPDCGPEERRRAGRAFDIAVCVCVCVYIAQRWNGRPANFRVAKKKKLRAVTMCLHRCLSFLSQDKESAIGLTTFRPTESSQERVGEWRLSPG